MRKVFAIIISLTFIITCIINVQAYNLIGYKLVSGVTYKKYYISSTASDFTSNIETAINQWMYPIGMTNKINFTKTTDYMNSQMDVFAEYRSSGTHSNANGWTEFGYRNPPRQLTYPDSNYDGGIIYLNIYNVTANTTRTVGVIAHEMGHVFGLHENNANQYAVMCQEAYGRLVTRAGEDDNNGVNYLYP